MKKIITSIILILLIPFTIYIINDLKDTIDDRVLPFLSFIPLFLVVGFIFVILRKEGE